MLQTAISVTTQVSEKCIVIDYPDVMESGMEMAGGSPPAEVDISVGPEVLPTAVSVMTKVSEKWMVIDSPDAVESGMEMAGGSPPAEVDISVGLDVLLTKLAAAPPDGLTRRTARLASRQEPSAPAVDLVTGKCRPGKVSRTVSTSPLTLDLTVRVLRKQIFCSRGLLLRGYCRQVPRLIQ